MRKEKAIIIILLVMIGWDASLHWADVFNLVNIHPLYPWFPLLGIPYQLFWAVFWTVGLIFITIIGMKKEVD